MVEDLSKEMEDIDLCEVVSEVNMVASNLREWWNNTGASCHICCDKGSFAGLTMKNNRGHVYMKNATISTIKGKGTVILKMTLEKEITLKNVLYTPDVWRNLVSGTLLLKHGFKVVIE